jgi:hypothetical protein
MDDSLPVRAAGLRPAQAYDYLAVRRRFGVGGSYDVVSETGRVCSTSTQTQCARAVAASDVEFVKTRCPDMCFEESIVTTRGDETRRWIGADAAKLLLGEIDSPDDALWLVASSGYELNCGDASRTSLRAVADGYEILATTFAAPPCIVCRTNYWHLHVSKSGKIKVLNSVLLEEQCGCAGRKPAGLRSRSIDLGESALGDFLAHCAHLEAASVVSFEQLERELAAYGAPPELIAAARAARADEVRHAELVGRLARARGGEPVKPEVEPHGIRALDEIALENVVEGCVRETFAALVAGYQAEHAHDRELREAMVGIAEDELRHAILAHRVQRWIAGKLDAQALARIEAAKARAVRELVREAAQPVADELQRAGGLPSMTVAGALVGELAHSLWSARAPGAPKAA